MVAYAAVSVYPMCPPTIIISGDKDILALVYFGVFSGGYHPDLNWS